MDINSYVQKIKRIIIEVKHYDEYRYIFKEYIDFLDNLLINDPSNIKAICQLAIAHYENRQDIDFCVALLEDALARYEASMSKDSLCELLNNLAYFYDEENGDYSKAEHLLNRAIQLNSKYQNSYYALSYLTVENNPAFALEIFNCIPNRENLSIYYQYMSAYILMRNGLYSEALEQFELLTHSYDTEIIEKSYYCCAIINSITYKTEQAILIEDKLYSGYKIGTNEEVLTFEMIYLNFQLHNYQRVIGLFGNEKTENIYVDVKTIKLYFYALKMLGLESDCERVFLEKIDELKSYIEEVRNDEDFNDEEKIDYIKTHEEDIQILTRNYSDVVLNNITVELDDVFYYCKARKQCYLIGCHRHF